MRVRWEERGDIERGGMWEEDRQTRTIFKGTNQKTGKVKVFKLGGPTRPSSDTHDDHIATLIMIHICIVWFEHDSGANTSLQTIHIVEAWLLSYCTIRIMNHAIKVRTAWIAIWFAMVIMGIWTGLGRPTQLENPNFFTFHFSSPWSSFPFICLLLTFLLPHYLLTHLVHLSSSLLCASDSRLLCNVLRCLSVLYWALASIVYMFNMSKPKREVDITWNYCESIPPNRQVKCKFYSHAYGVA